MRRQFLNRVTITGADNSMPHQPLIRLSRLYPFTEFGILLSESKQGTNRYPSSDWFFGLGNYDLRLSGHLCGRWARDLVSGDFHSGNRVPASESFHLGNRIHIWKLFTRLQLNISNILSDVPKQQLQSIIDACPDKRLIMQVGKDGIPANLNGLACDFLFDSSGGRGELATGWPAFVPNCGYAGGLTPHNLADELTKISEVVPEGNLTWIDVESGVRTNDVFDIGKVERFLSIANAYVLK